MMERNGLSWLRSKGGYLNKTLFAIYYPWYPWRGMQYLTGATGNQPVNVNGYVRQDAFVYPFTNPIPYLRSPERPLGLQDYQAAVAWHKCNIEQAVSAGIDVLLVIGRPDLAEWPDMLESLFEARRLVYNAPLIAFMFDGLELWDTTSPKTGDLTHDGPDFAAIWEGVRRVFDMILEHPNDLFWYGSRLPVFFYRIEVTSGPFVADNWWTNELRTRVRDRFHRDLCIILDHYWYGSTPYGVGLTMATTNGDNYFKYGSAAWGVLNTPHSTDFKIIDIGPGFDNSKISPAPLVVNRADGSRYIGQWTTMKTVPNTYWVIVESLNFGEESSQIDDTAAWGIQYLEMTKAQSEAWKAGN